MVISSFVFSFGEEGKDIETMILKRPYLAVFSPSVIQTLLLLLSCFSRVQLCATP